MKLLKYFIIASLFFVTSVSQVLAESKTFVREYTYQASEFDSKASCRTLALEQVKRLLLEEIGTYLESLTEVNNFQLTKDQIIVLTAGIVGIQVVNEKWDGKSYYLLAKITANPDDVTKAIDNLRKDRQKIKELEQAKKKSDDLFKEVENLREELKASTNKKTKAFRLKQTEYENMINSVNAIEWFTIRDFRHSTPSLRTGFFSDLCRWIKRSPRNQRGWFFILGLNACKKTCRQRMVQATQNDLSVY